ncbi:hypothetical protein BD309DRAFT_866752, partial [Dichomitus squalens]
YVSAALFVYDFILTFESEAMLFWMGRYLSGATVLFLLNRYSTLASQIVGVLPYPSSVETHSECIHSTRTSYIALVVVTALQYLPWAAFSALRSYALCPDLYRWPVSASVFALSSVPIITNMWGDLYRFSVVSDPVSGMEVTTPVSASTRIQLAVATRSSLIASDLIVLCVTWYRTYESAKLSIRGLGRRSFASILCLNGGPPPDAHHDAVSSLTSMLTSRFLIDLQKVQRKLADSSRSVSLGELALQPQPSRKTGRLIESLGAQLSFHEYGEENEDEDAS